MTGWMLGMRPVGWRPAHSEPVIVIILYVKSMGHDLLCDVIPLDCQSVILVSFVCDYHAYLYIACHFDSPIHE